jgi:hypothetical protein
VIRRAFWLAVGATGGIMGYRRVARLARRGVTGDVIRATREARSFSRDVREGMELYSARRHRGAGPTLREVASGAAAPRAAGGEPSGSATCAASRPAPPFRGRPAEAARDGGPSRPAR